MVSRKRGRQEMEEAAVEPPKEPSTLDRLRNMWEFANLMQFIFIFGKAVKIDDDFGIEDLEEECLKPERSQKLEEIGLALLKFVSSHRGLTPDLFDEYTRRQYQARAPQRNPFGDDEAPLPFAEFDIFTKIRVLWQLSQWTMIHSERIRERMPEQKDSEQTQWRVEEIGYDSNGRSYFVLDDNRLYRRTEAPPPPQPTWKPKANTKKAKAAARAAKRRRVSRATEEEQETDDGNTQDPSAIDKVDNGLGGDTWECLAINLQQYTDFLESIRKSRDPNEKYLHKTVTDDVLPIIQKLEEEQQRKAARREKELLNLHKLASAKRSSRIADKLERQKAEEEAAEAERRRQAELERALKEQQRQREMEEARESRMMTREQRLKDREMRRILHEQELARLAEDSKNLSSGEARMSERHLKAEMERRQKELEKIAQEEEWVFDCSVCGVHGENIDDGSHSVACEKCNVWQHSACLGISQEEAERDDFHFICRDCKRRIEDAAKPKLPSLKFRVAPSSSPPQPHNPEQINNGDLGSVVKQEDTRATPTLLGGRAGESGLTASSVRPAQAVPRSIEDVNKPYMSHVAIGGPKEPGPSASAANGFRPDLAGSPSLHGHRPDDEGRIARLPAASVNGFATQQPARPVNGQASPDQRIQTPLFQANTPHLSGPFASQSTPFSDGRPTPLDPLTHIFRQQQASSPPQPSPVKNPFPASSPQENRDAAARPVHNFSQTSRPDGLPTLVQHSPGRLSSPPQLHPSSPPSYSGVSPTKHSSPPRPMSSQSLSNVPLFPPVASLSPSPNPANVKSPTKAATPEAARVRGQ